MINVFRDSGFEVVQALEGGSIHVNFPIGGMVSLRERVELRDRIAAANSLVPLPQPRTVAVAVPVGNVLAVAEEALKSGTKVLLVVTSGFAESGPEGASLQSELMNLVRSHGARLIEELPWLCSMEAEIHKVEPAPGQCAVVPGPQVKIDFCK